MISFIEPIRYIVKMMEESGVEYSCTAIVIGWATEYIT